jgi:hypothetical protein
MKYVLVILMFGALGCAMAEYGSHSLSASPFETPGNLASNGWRPAPRPESGESYHGRSGQSTRDKFNTAVNRDGRKLKIDGLTCSCSVQCKLKGDIPPRVGGWGFGRDYSTATERAAQDAREKCFARKWKTKMGLKISGYPIGNSLKCDDEKACLVHYTEED